MTNGPRPTISLTRAEPSHAFAKVPASSAASSLCRGRIGRLSSRRIPGPNGEGNRMTTVEGSGALTASGWPPTRIASPIGLPIRGS